ncbi:MAG: hypothetical protein NWE95_01975 [Candidatus Bathyarchaeota archaeon]|nr:hypothetical protein [Candidatus Bathyarchaeota archaeon]
MDTKTALTILFAVLLVLGAGVYIAYRLGYIRLSLAGSVVVGNSTSVSDTGSSSSNSSSAVVDAVNNSFMPRLNTTFSGFVEAFRGFVSGIARNITTGNRLDVIINASVYAIIFIVVGILAEMLVKVVKFICYGLAAISIIVALLALFGII